MLSMAAATVDWLSPRLGSMELSNARSWKSPSHNDSATASSLVLPNFTPLRFITATQYRRGGPEEGPLSGFIDAGRSTAGNQPRPIAPCSCEDGTRLPR